MSDWQPKTLGEITDWFSGGTPSKQNESYWNGDIPWISAKTLKGTRVSDSELKITQEGLDNGSRIAQEGDLLLLVRGSGLFNSIPISIVEKPVSFNQDIKAIRVKKEYDYISPWFLLYWLHGNTRILNGIMEETGIGAGKFDLNLLKDLIIELPSKEELKEITQTFKSIDDKIVLLQQRNQDLEELVQILFKRWFVEFEFPDENGEPYKSSGGKMISSILGEIPETWKVDEIYKLIEVQYGYPFKSNLFNVDSKGIPLIRIRDLKKGETGFFTEESYKPEYLVNCGDILAGMDAEFRPYIWSGSKGLLNQRVCKFIGKNNISELFVLEFMRSHLDFFEKTKGGTTVIHLGKGDLDSIEALIPNENVIERFNEIVKPIHSIIINNNNELRVLTRLRDILLPKLMSGELRVKHY